MSEPHGSRITHRLGALGYASFFGDEAGKAAGLDWFTGRAWSCALEAADAADMESCTVTLAAYTSLLGAHTFKTRNVQVAVK